jgi:predicted HAD superfamily Cof-like phosphohydrolase
MTHPQDQVIDFHLRTGSAVAERPSRELLALRLRLIREEYEEVREELLAHRPDLTKIAKELADVLYVVYGTAASLGIDLEGAFHEVHASNMSKLVDGKALKREDGKVLKGPNYFEADVSPYAPTTVEGTTDDA